MKKIMWLSFIICLTFITLYSTKQYEELKNEVYDYTFQGETENWKAVYSVKEKEASGKKEEGVYKYIHREESSFALSYQGDVEVSPKSLKYSYKSNAGGGSGTKEVSKSVSMDDVVVHRSSSSGGTKINKDALIEVTIEWDGEEEVFQMRYVKEQEQTDENEMK